MEDCPTLCTSGWSFLYPDRDHLVDDDYIQDLGQYPFVFDESIRVSCGINHTNFF